MEENIKSLILIASELEAFKLKVYTLLNKEKWLDDFIMNNAPCNYNLQTLIRDIQEGKVGKKMNCPICNGVMSKIDGVFVSYCIASGLI